MRKTFVVIIMMLVVGLIPGMFHSHVVYADNFSKELQGSVPSTSSSATPASAQSAPQQLPHISGAIIFDPNGSSPVWPDVGNYVFDANGFTGNFDPLYWAANLLFAATISMMFVGMEFFDVGYSTNGLNGLVDIVLKILHSAYIHIALPLIPLVVLMLIGVFVWFGVIKKDLPSVFGRVTKTGMVFMLIVVLSSPAVVKSGMIQKVGDFPGQLGTFFGGIVEGVVASATGAKADGTSNLVNNAWVALALDEWVTGEEGQNYNETGTKVVPLTDETSAWRYMLLHPTPFNSDRNGVAQTLQNTPDGPDAFASTNRLIVSWMAFVGNAGPMLYFAVMGAVMFVARLMFLVCVAAGAVILPLELFPVTRSSILALRWIQYMAMSLFAIFFVSAYSSVLFGLTELIQTAASASVFADPTNKTKTAFLEGVHALSFLVQGLAYIIAILFAWVLYKKMKPMQRIKTMTERAASRGRSLRTHERLTVQARRSAPWERSSNMRKSRDTASESPKRRTSMFDRAADAAREGVRSAWSKEEHASDGSSGDREFESERFGEGFTSVPDASDENTDIVAHPLASRELGALTGSPERDGTTSTGDSSFDVTGTVVDESSERAEDSTKKIKPEESLNAIDQWQNQWQNRMNLIRKGTAIMAAPDAMMDRVMGATLGKAADQIAKVGGKIASRTITRAAKRYESARIQNAKGHAGQGQPVKDRDKQNPAKFERGKKWTVVDAEVIPPSNSTSRYSDWFERQKAARDRIGERHQTPSRPASVDQKLLGPAAQSNGRRRQSSGPVAMSRHFPAGSSKSGGLDTRPGHQMARLRPGGKLQSATVSQIRTAQLRSRGNKIKATESATPSPGSTQKRPSLRRASGTSLSQRIFGDGQ